MKNQIIQSIVVISFVILFAVVSASAQTNNQIAANIPFDFYVKNQKFAAGEYLIERASPGALQATLVFRQKDGKNSRIVMMLPLAVNNQSGKAQPSLIFNQYGSDYFLSEIRNPAENFGAQLPKVKKERTLAMQSGKAKRETVVLTSTRR